MLIQPPRVFWGTPGDLIDDRKNLVGAGISSYLISNVLEYRRTVGAEIDGSFPSDINCE